MSETLRKGWCPGALRPMAAKDGWLVRLRITGGIVSAAMAHAIADLAARTGNGLFDLSARGNLQMRGVGERSLPTLHEGLRALGLLDGNAAAESVRNVIASPLAGLHDGLDIRSLTKALEAGLTDDTTLHALPNKFGLVIDDGGTPSLADIHADVRFDWIKANESFAIGLAGTRDDAVWIGNCGPSDIVQHAAQIARGALSLFRRCPDGRRMRDLVMAFGAADVARACGGQRLVHPLPAEVTGASDLVGHRTFGGVSVLGLAAPFGRLDARMLHEAAARAETTPVGELRLTPWRAILVPGAGRDAPTLCGFIADPADPRLAIAACVGAEGCARGTTSTHADAEWLAVHAKAAPGIRLHVSGCAKGCAKPSPSPLTLVARGGLYDLVRNGQAGDPPSHSDLDLGAAREMILEPA